MAAISDLSLKINYWFVSNRQRFRRWWFILIVAIDFFLLLYIVIGLAIYISGFSIASSNISTISPTVLSAGYKASHRPLDLEVLEPSLLQRGGGRADISVRVDNGNKDWAAVVGYTYKVGSEILTAGSSYVGPDTTAYLLGLNVALPETTLVSTVESIIDKIEWVFVPSRPEAVIPSFLVTSTNRSLSGGEATVVSSTISNNSVVNWKEVVVQVIMTIGNKVVGVNQFIVRDWQSLTEENISVQWRRSFSDQVQVNSLPVVNPFDQSPPIR
jgi:hypothetical protein